MEKPEIQYRLDFLPCPAVSNAEILSGYRTDHLMIIVRINTVTNPRGPGFWKLLRNASARASR